MRNPFLKLGERIYTRSFTILTVLTALLFLVISYNDTKGDWPMLFFAMVVIFVGTPVEKLTYLPVILGWLYLWIVVFNKHLYRRHLLLLAIGALWIMVIFPVYSLFTSKSLGAPEDITRNHWAIFTSAFFLTNSGLLVFQMFNTRKQ